jgi:type I restriction enzyme S subunit
LIPSDDALLRFNKALKSYFKKIYYNNLENKKLIQIRDKLLPKLMSGEIDVSKVEI